MTRFGWGALVLGLSAWAWAPSGLQAQSAEAPSQAVETASADAGEGDVAEPPPAAGSTAAPGLFDRARGKGPASSAVAQVDPALAGGLGTKIAACYEQERHHPLAAADLALLGEYAAMLVLELQDALGDTPCAPTGESSPECLEAVGKLECGVVAEAIRGRGWHRHLPPEAKLTTERFAQALTSKYALCRAREGMQLLAEQLQVESTRLNVLAQAMLTTGQCQLVMPSLPEPPRAPERSSGEAPGSASGDAETTDEAVAPHDSADGGQASASAARPTEPELDAEEACQARLDALPCDQVFEHAKAGKLLQLCPNLMPCGTPDVPGL